MNKKSKDNPTTLTVLKPSALPVPAITPKPTKADVINAAVERARQKYEEHRDAQQALKDEAEKELIEACRKFIANNMDSIEFGVSPNCYGKDTSVSIDATISSPDINRIAKKMHNIHVPWRFDEDTERAKIKQALDSTGDRVKLILSNDENVKLIDSLLEKINLKTKKDALA